MQLAIQLGSRVYLRNAIAGEPGVVHGFDRAGRAIVEWVDMPELGRWTHHALDSLTVAESYRAHQLGLEFEEQAA